MIGFHRQHLHARPGRPHPPLLADRERAVPRYSTYPPHGAGPLLRQVDGSANRSKTLRDAPGRSHAASSALHSP